MQSKLIRIIMLLTILTCLPVQGLAAVTFLTCPMDGKQQTGMVMDSDDATAMAGCQHDQKDSQPSKEPTCGKCFVCHLAVTQAIMMANKEIPVDSVSIKIASLNSAVPEKIPSVFFHPPRPASA